MPNEGEGSAPTGLPEVVLEVGGEGGSIKLLRGKTTSGEWQFWVKTNESALYDLLPDEDRGEPGDYIQRTDYVPSFEEALKLLDRYPWAKLYPLQVHPEFLEAVLKGVRKRPRREVTRWKETLENRRPQ